ncbi:hypothetical protein CPC08DRAFT_766383 [Agrocybe pediades]|nr:hypothetical protein CPC08DRAFT_766383 [Agrocybe pediades]
MTTDISLTSLALTEDVAQYVKAKFISHLKGKDELISFPDTWTYEMLLDCDVAARVLAQAHQNQDLMGSNQLY